MERRVHEQYHAWKSTIPAGFAFHQLNPGTTTRCVQRHEMDLISTTQPDARTTADTRSARWYYLDPRRLKSRLNLIESAAARIRGAALDVFDRDLRNAGSLREIDLLPTDESPSGADLARRDHAYRI
jgi:hypothetical protein